MENEKLQSEIENRLNIEGIFLIQKMYKIKLTKDIVIQKLKDKLVKNLPEFKKGTSENQGFGFEILDNENLPDSIKLDENLNDVMKNLIIIEFKKEKYGKIIKEIKKGKPVHEIKLKNLLYNHIFISFPNYVYFKGSKENIEYLETKFFKIIQDYIAIIDF